MTAPATPSHTGNGRSGALDVDPDSVARAVRAVPGVAALSSGSLGEIATYLPGRRVAGIRIRDDHVLVAVVAEFGASLPMLSTAIRATVAAQLPGIPCDVLIEDITDAAATRPVRS